MKTARLARSLGLDGNPLRRRTDKIAACAAALLLAAFLIGAPLLWVAAVGWAGRSAAVRLQAERSWHQVPAILLQAVPPPNAAGRLLGYSGPTWPPTPTASATTSSSTRPCRRNTSKTTSAPKQPGYGAPCGPQS